MKTSSDALIIGGVELHSRLFIGLLLYKPVAADERHSGNTRGGRIIKKKNKNEKKRSTRII